MIYQIKNTGWMNESDFNLFVRQNIDSVGGKVLSRDKAEISDEAVKKLHTELYGHSFIPGMPHNTNVWYLEKV